MTTREDHYIFNLNTEITALENKYNYDYEISAKLQPSLTIFYLDIIL